MEVFFDHKSDILDARLRAAYDRSVVYTVKSSFGLLGRKITFLHDANAVWAGSPPVVGAIHWREKAIEVYGHKKRVADVKKLHGRFFARTRVWRWSDSRTAYRIQYRAGKWTLTLNKDEGELDTLGTFTVPSRPHLFGKTPSPLLYLSPDALLDDEIFLILVFIYSETRRRDKNNHG